MKPVHQMRRRLGRYLLPLAVLLSLLHPTTGAAMITTRDTSQRRLQISELVRQQGSVQVNPQTAHGQGRWQVFHGEAERSPGGSGRGSGGIE